MTAWMRAMSSADWEPAPPLPVGMRHPLPGELAEIRQIARKRLPRVYRNIGGEVVSPMSIYSEPFNDAKYRRGVMEIVDRIIRERGIFIEGM